MREYGFSLARVGEYGSVERVFSHILCRAEATDQFSLRDAGTFITLNTG